MKMLQFQEPAYVSGYQVPPSEDNALKAVDINNKLTINAIDVARENLRIYNRTVNEATEFSNKIAKVCTSLLCCS
jgi:hypothetical protein